MVPTKIPTAPISEAKYIHYWRNAKECFAGMHDAALHQRWHLTALSGIHCVIAAADALVIHTAGLRCRSKDHLDVFILLSQHAGDPDAGKMLKHGVNVWCGGRRTSSTAQSESARLMLVS